MKSQLLLFALSPLSLSSSNHAKASANVQNQLRQINTVQPGGSQVTSPADMHVPSINHFPANRWLEGLAQGESADSINECRDQSYERYIDMTSICEEKGECVLDVHAAHTARYRNCTNLLTDDQIRGCQSDSYHLWRDQEAQCPEVEAYKQCESKAEEYLDRAFYRCENPYPTLAPSSSSAPSISSQPTSELDLAKPFMGLSLSTNELDQLNYCLLLKPPETRLYNVFPKRSDLPSFANRYNTTGCVPYAEHYGVEALASALDEAASAWGGHTAYVASDESSDGEGLDIYYCPNLRQFGASHTVRGPGVSGDAMGTILLQGNSSRTLLHELGHDTYCLNHPFGVPTINHQMFASGTSEAEWSIMNYCGDFPVCAETPTEFDLAVVNRMFAQNRTAMPIPGYNVHYDNSLACDTVARIHLDQIELLCEANEEVDFKDCKDNATEIWIQADQACVIEADPSYCHIQARETQYDPAIQACYQDCSDAIGLEIVDLREACPSPSPSRNPALRRTPEPSRSPLSMMTSLSPSADVNISRDPDYDEITVAPSIGSSEIPTSGGTLPRQSSLSFSESFNPLKAFNAQTATFVFLALYQFA